MDDPEDEQDLVLGQDVAHDPVVSDPESMEFVLEAADRRNPLALDSPTRREGGRQVFEGCPDAIPDLRRELPECPRRSRREGDSIRRQARSARSTALPWA
jgi:hypothetical protein